MTDPEHPKLTDAEIADELAAFGRGRASRSTPQEPSSDSRGAARVLRDYFLALTAEGFTEPQALAIVGSLLARGGR